MKKLRLKDYEEIKTSILEKKWNINRERTIDGVKSIYFTISATENITGIISSDGWYCVEKNANLSHKDRKGKYKVLASISQEKADQDIKSQILKIMYNTIKEV